MMNPVRVKLMFTVHRSPLTIRSQFTVIHEVQWLMANSKRMVNASEGGLG